MARDEISAPFSGGPRGEPIARGRKMQYVFAITRFKEPAHVRNANFALCWPHDGHADGVYGANALDA
jgi:hypothetical protein